MRLGIIGATGMVGRTMVRVLEEQRLPVEQINLYATKNSLGEKIAVNGIETEVHPMGEKAFGENDVFLASAGKDAALLWGNFARHSERLIIDNSSAWRMHADVPLIVPEINADEIDKHNFIISNPNCSTIQLVLPLAPLMDRFGIRRVVVATYQSVTGSGKKAVDQLNREISGRKVTEPAYPHPIAYNCLPHIDVFLQDGYTREEHKMMQETTKILGRNIPLTVTCVRVPTFGGHAEAVNLELEHPFELEEIRETWKNTPGIKVVDDPEYNQYPMPLTAQGSDLVYVGRLRRDETVDNGLNFWVVSDNLRKGAATNAVQILKSWIERKQK